MNQHERNEVILNFAKEFQRFKGEFNSMEIPQYGILVDEKALLTIEEDYEIQKIFLERVTQLDRYFYINFLYFYYNLII